MRFGNISPSSTHTIGPQLRPNATTYRFAATSATMFQGSGNVSAAPSPVACENDTAIRPSVSAMPAEPTSSSGLRPTLSTSAMATSVTSTLTTDVATVIENESASLKPTERHSVDE